MPNLTKIPVAGARVDTEANFESKKRELNAGELVVTSDTHKLVAMYDDNGNGVQVANLDDVQDATAAAIDELIESDGTSVTGITVGESVQQYDYEHLDHKLDKTAIAPLFDSTQSYAVGDCVIHDGQLYKCRTAGSGAWNAARWTLSSVVDVAASADALDEAVTELKGDFSDLESGILSAEAKTALLDCFAHTAWIDENGQDYYDALRYALLGSEPYITAQFTQGDDAFFTDDSLDEFKDNLVVTLHEGENHTVIPASNYTLSGTLVEGRSTINVSYLTYNDTFTADVLTNIAGNLNNIHHSTVAAAGTYTYSNGVISVKAASQSAVNNWWMWMCDSKTNHFDDLEGKTLCYRIKVKRQQTTDDDAFINWYSGLFASAEQASMNDNTRRLSVLDNHLVPTTEYTKHSGIVVADINNYSTGSIVPDENTMIGHLIFIRSLDTIDFASIKMGVIE